MNDDDIDWENTSFAIARDKVWALYEIKRLRNELKMDAEIFDELKMGEGQDVDFDDEEKAVAVQVFWTVGVLTGEIE